MSTTQFVVRAIAVLVALWIVLGLLAIVLMSAGSGHSERPVRIQTTHR